MSGREQDRNAENEVQIFDKILRSTFFRDPVGRTHRKHSLEKELIGAPC